MKNSISDVRNLLIAQLERLDSEDCDVNKEYLRSEAMQMVATPIINSAKIEADLMAKSKGEYVGTGFISNKQKQIQ